MLKADGSQLSRFKDLPLAEKAHLSQAQGLPPGRSTKAQPQLARRDNPTEPAEIQNSLQDALSLSAQSCLLHSLGMPVLQRLPLQASLPHSLILRVPKIQEATHIPSVPRLISYATQVLKKMSFEVKQT